MTAFSETPTVESGIIFTLIFTDFDYYCLRLRYQSACDYATYLFCKIFFKPFEKLKQTGLGKGGIKSENQFLDWDIFLDCDSQEAKYSDL